VTTFGLPDLVDAWVLSPVGVGTALLLSAGYACVLVSLHRRGGHLPALRVITFAVLGVGSLVLATCGGLAAHRDTSFVAAAAQSAVLAAVTPVGLALGDPVGLGLGVLSARRASSVRRLLDRRVVRAAAFHLAMFVTPWLARSLDHAWLREVTYAVLVGSGLVFVLPLLADDLAPSWCTPGVRVLVGFWDGLLDAVPGVVVLASPVLLGAPVGAYLRAPDPGWEQHVGGGVMFALAELVGLPLLAATVAAWVRADHAEAAAVDARLDLEPASDRPWWEDDPRFRHPPPCGGRCRSAQACSAGRSVIEIELMQ
jgi:cytochrome c oxidase assembly factor CtaG